MEEKNLQPIDNKKRKKARNSSERINNGNKRDNFLPPPVLKSVVADPQP